MNSNSVSNKPKLFISPSPVVAVPEQFDVEWNMLEPEGLFVDVLDENGDINEVFFIPVSKMDVEEWILENGEEDVHWENEKDWVDEYPNGGHHANFRVLIEDAKDEGIRLYAENHRENWKQHS